MITGIISSGFIVLYYGLTPPIGWKQIDFNTCINLYGAEWSNQSLSKPICIEKL